MSTGKEKCAVCSKTVYPTERMSIDGTLFHQDCLKCTQCHKKISNTNFGKLDGQYYCKPHTLELIKRRGKYEGKKEGDETKPENTQSTSSEQQQAKNEETTSTGSNGSSNSSSTEPTEHVNKNEAKKKFEKKPVEEQSTKPTVVKQEKKATTTQVSSGGSTTSGKEKCAVCSKTVYPTERMSIDGTLFHQDCLKCTQCNKKISNTNFGKLDGKYYCKPHTLELIKRRGKYEGKREGDETKSEGTTTTADGGDSKPQQEEILSETVVQEEIVEEQEVKN
jgi:cysteine/glycine-rich protein